MGKSANEHRAIIRPALGNNDKVGLEVLVFSGTSDNGPNVSFGMDQY